MLSPPPFSSPKRDRQGERSTITLEWSFENLNGRDSATSPLFRFNAGLTFLCISLPLLGFLTETLHLKSLHRLPPKIPMSFCPCAALLILSLMPPSSLRRQKRDSSRMCHALPFLPPSWPSLSQLPRPNPSFSFLCFCSREREREKTENGEPRRGRERESFFF